MADGLGIIIPPPTRKPIIDKTAAFVAKKGRQVEEEILSRPQGQNAANFTFLLDDDPFHAYYLSKVAEFQAGGAPQQPQAPEATKAAQSQTSATASEVNAVTNNTVAAAPVLRASSLVEALRSSSKKKGQEPPPFEFILEKPYDATKYEIELIKMTAQFAATDGKKFEADLFHKEKQNLDEFGFLHASHPHHSYYTELVRCYKKLLEGKIEWVTEITKSGGRALLERAVHRFEHRREEAMKQMETDEKRALERAAYLEIDWQDFVVVETIRFDDDVNDEALQGLGIDELVSDAANAVGVMDDSDEIGEIRRDFAVQPVRATMNVPMVTLANGQQIPVTEMNETMRANLLDPKWREYQERFEAKQRDTNLAEGGSMPAHLARMAGARPDVFGGEKEEAERRWDERKRKDFVAWDGNPLNADSAKAAAASFAASRPQAPIKSIFSTAPQPPPFPGMPPKAPAMPAIPGSFPPPPPRPGMAPSPPASGPNETDSASSKRLKMGSNQEGYIISVPAAGPGGLGPTDLNLSAPESMSVSDFKDRISAALSNVAVSKFQLKAADGRFLKNTDMMDSVPVGSVIELKWKSR